MNDHATRPDVAETAPPAVVCDMTDAPDTGEQRLAEYARLFAEAFVARERTPAGFRWRLRADAGVEAWARDLAAREMACCAFLSITVTRVDGEVRWDTTTIDDPAATAVLELMYELPEAEWAGVDELHERFVRTTGVPIVGFEADHRAGS
ncbi:hypothetical protein [Pseudonocardia lacus]|uniref:hypothetical protein n=1 Tax=Pseudonocardia lacus TaxID=2835865 RepID=UPI001BDD09C5|nr:hypothetical protein [Pseudonocardia lacus]